MGLPVYTPQVIRCAFQGTVGDRNWTNVIHYKYEAGPPSMEDLTAMGVALFNAWVDSMTPLQDPDTSIVTVKLTDLTSALSAQVEFGTTTPGTREGAYLPASASMLLTYLLDYRYRGGHPRNYVSCGVQGDLDSAQEWTTDFLTEVVEGWNTVTNTPLGETYGSTTITSLGFVQMRLHDDPFSVGVFYPFASPSAIGQQPLGTIKRRIRRGKHRA